MLTEGRFKIDNRRKIIARPSIALREEEDNWGILVNPDSNSSFGLNPLGVLLWKHIDGWASVSDLVAKVYENCLDVPGEVEAHIEEFIEELLIRDLVMQDTREK
jgi:SynChlorMet cassette protein ScmD